MHYDFCTLEGNEEKRNRNMMLNLTKKPFEHGSLTIHCYLLLLGESDEMVSF